jgi:TrmH family RNA methyltransferase
MWRKLTSLQNPQVKLVERLWDRKHRLARQEAVVEGLPEISRAAAGGFRGKTIFFCPNWCDPTTAAELADRLHVPEDKRFEVSSAVYEKMTYGQRREGLLAVIKIAERPIASLPIRRPGLYLVLEGIEKPGNLGAIFRSADAVGVHGIVVTDARCDPWNPNAVRASLGCIFTVPFAVATVEAAIQWLGQHQVKVVTADPQAPKTFWEVGFRESVAVVLGTEHAGLSDRWAGLKPESARIPMYGSADSLNVSVAAALFLYEALRQRMGSSKGTRTP